MPLITEPDDITSATTVADFITFVNAIKNAIYELVNGEIDDDNVAAGADILPSKIADGAMVLENTVVVGQQELKKPTRLGARQQFKEAELGGWSFDEDDTQAVSINGATTFALTAGKGLYQVSIVGAETLTTITGGQEGDVIYLLWEAADNTLTVTHTAAQTADTLSLRGRANETWTVAGGKFVTRFRYSAVGGTGKWYEC